MSERDAHERAIEAAAAHAYGHITMTTDIIAAYLASLAEQGDPLVRVSEVARFVRTRSDHWSCRKLAHDIEARFAPGTGEDER